MNWLQLRHIQIIEYQKKWKVCLTCCAGFLNFNRFCISSIKDSDEEDIGFQKESLTDEYKIKTIIDATEYCNVAEADRNMPTYEPQINRTLAYASTKVSVQIEDEYQFTLKLFVTILLQIKKAVQSSKVSKDKHETNIQLLPLSGQLSLVCMMVLWYGTYTAMNGW